MEMCRSALISAINWRAATSGSSMSRWPPWARRAKRAASAALIADIYRSLAAEGLPAPLTRAMQLACQRLEGAFTLLAIHQDQPDTVVAARRNSPLVVGLGEGENFLGSDVSGFIDFTRRAVELGQDQIVTITPESFEVYSRS